MKKPHKISTSLAKGKSLPKPRTPRDYPWVLLKALISDLRESLKGEDIALVDSIVRNRDITGYMQLSETWGLQSINSNHDSTVTEMVMKYQIASLLKRFPFETEKSSRVESAIKKFYDAETCCARFNHHDWLDLACPLSDDIVEIFSLSRAFIQKVLDILPEFVEVCEWSRHGPGATLSTFDGNNSKYAKFSDWPYDVTKAALGHARLAITIDRRWLGALEDDYRSVMEIPKHHIINQEVFWSNLFHIVDHNRVTTVPKDALTERTIAIEPTLNLYLQLGVDGFIRKRLKRFGVDLDDQSKNRELARIGSITGGFATVDLKSASDSVATKLCKLLLPPIWYNYLMDLRSPYGELREKKISYEKISSMGNGYTFALESLIFTSVVYGVMRHFKGSFEHRKFAVFGDDLIVESDIAPMLVFYLKRFGFATNINKSFYQGFVRESCGADWFHGLQIRPVFITEYPTDIKQLFSARNRLRMKLEIQWGLCDSYIVSLMDKWCPDKLLELTGPPTSEDMDSYRHISFPFGKRWEKGQFYEIRRCISSPKLYCGNQFFFRKLMTNLRPVAPAPFYEKKTGVKGGGSCFEITRRGRVRLSVVTSRAYSWPETYLT